MIQCPALCWGTLEGALGSHWGAKVLNSFNTTPALQHRLLLLPTIELLLLMLNTMWILKTSNFLRRQCFLQSNRITFRCLDLSCGPLQQSSVFPRCYVAFHNLCSLCISILVEPMRPPPTTHTFLLPVVVQITLKPNHYLYGPASALSVQASLVKLGALSPSSTVKAAELLCPQHCQMDGWVVSS